MNILVTGGSGFIASQIVTDLLAAGHNITCCVRNIAYAKNIFPTVQIIQCNFIKDTNSDIWVERLKNIDVVINCVGILYHPDKKIIWAVHYDTPRALFDACQRVGVKQVIQISALGVDKSPVEYSKSKKAADDYLQSLALNSIILRPSLVYGRGSYGGTSLFRGLTGLPFIIPVPGNGTQEFQPIHLEDLSKAIVNLIEKPLQQTILLNAVGSKRITLSEILTKMRAWLGFSKAKLMFVPLIFIRLGSLFGDRIPYSAMNSSSYKMLNQNNITSDESAKQFHDAIGFIPRDFVTGLYSQPSTVQDHWHARLYFLKPLLQASLGFVWLFTAVCTALIYPWEASYSLLASVGVSAYWQPILLLGAIFIDGFLGIAMLTGFRLQKICVALIVLILFYTTILTIKLPYLWVEPFMPLAKNIPMIVATLILLALESDR